MIFQFQLSLHIKCPMTPRGAGCHGSPRVVPFAGPGGSLGDPLRPRYRPYGGELWGEPWAHRATRFFFLVIYFQIILIFNTGTQGGHWMNPGRGATDMFAIDYICFRNRKMGPWPNLGPQGRVPQNPDGVCSRLFVCIPECFFDIHVRVCLSGCFLCCHLLWLK